MRRWCASRRRCATATSRRRASRRSRLLSKWQWMWNRLSPGDPGEFMRNRYLVMVATALMAVLLVNATGCKSNPEKAKKKYLERRVKYVDKKENDGGVLH